MNATLFKALVVLVPGGMLLIGSVILFRRDKTVFPLLQLLGICSISVTYPRFPPLKLEHFSARPSAMTEADPA